MPRLLSATALLALLPTLLAAETFSADVWADNWFDMRIDGQLVAEDSVSITTERSFNAESFTFEAERPFTIGLFARDFIENDTGLEYIGTRRQQMGDGGIIAQITDADGADGGRHQCGLAMPRHPYGPDRQDLRKRERPGSKPRRLRVRDLGPA
ncbi:hypothetical protein [Jannaschia sp. 2305UL9-9]|uniref:hypothetical protein n=1 Tax=Jannaschia sp. 2305UL9-9 TaxID=3121638 RepID=UPI003527964B